MKNKKQTKKAVAYYRTATTKQSGVNSIEDQKRQCEDWAKKNGYEIDQHYADNGVSGTKLSGRDELIHAIARCQDKSDPIEALLVTNIDRLSRNAVDYFFVKNELGKSNTRVFAVNQPMIDNTPEGQFIEEILAGVSVLCSKTSKKERRHCENCGNLL